jgi:organic hydroperoxide reductase OsmC/OhrA
MAEEHELGVTIEHLRDLEFKVSFDWPEAGELLMDEPEPIGHRKGPNAARLLGAAIGNCLTASLLFCLRRSKLELAGTRTKVVGHVVRNDQGRMRVGKYRVRIDLPVAAEERASVERCLSLFEDYCVVTASIRSGIHVAVDVHDRDGGTLYSSAH